MVLLSSDMLTSKRAFGASGILFSFPDKLRRNEVSKEQFQPARGTEKRKLNGIHN